MFVLSLCSSFAMAGSLDVPESWLVQTRAGLAGDYSRYQQRIDGVPVLAGEVVVLREQGRVRRVVDGTVALGDWRVPVAQLTRAQAVDRATAGLQLRGPVRAHLAVDDGPTLVWRVEVPARAPMADLDVRIDAGTGEVRSRTDLLREAQGEGFVFDPNPIATSGNPDLDDDSAESLFVAEQVLAPLPGLDGTGALVGRWAEVFGGIAHEPSLAFHYDRTDDRFEEVNAYFHIDRAQRWLQALGFTDVNAHAQRVNPRANVDDRSFYTAFGDLISMGTGAVDDSEDGDILVHEYGHAVQHDQIVGFNWNDDSNAMGEGFADYLAAVISLDSAQVNDAACVGEWDAAGWNDACLRRVDGHKHFPEDWEGEEHADGEIWSAALWQARQELGGGVMDRLVIEHQFLRLSGSDMPEAAQMLVDADDMLNSGANGAALRRILTDRGVWRTVGTPDPRLIEVLENRPVDLGNTRRGNRYDDRADETVTHTVPGAAGLRLHFDRIEVDTSGGCDHNSCDNVYVTDGDGQLWGLLYGTQAAIVDVPGDTAHIRLVTDDAGRGYGWHVDQVEVLGLCTECPEPDEPEPQDPEPEGPDDEGDTGSATVPGPTVAEAGAAREPRAGCGCDQAPAGLGAVWWLALLAARRRS